METIFDYNITDSEMIDLLGFVMNKSEYLEGLCQNDCYCHIYKLLINRGEKKKAKKILDKIVNDEYKFFSLTNVGH